MLIKYTRLTDLWSSVFTYLLRRVCTPRWNWNNPCSASLVEYEHAIGPIIYYVLWCRWYKYKILAPFLCFKFTHLRCCVLSYALRTFFSFQDGRGVNKKYDAFAYRGISDVLHINQTKNVWISKSDLSLLTTVVVKMNITHDIIKKNRIVFSPDLVHVNLT